MKKLTNKILQNKLLILILFVSLFVRLFKVDTMPSSLNWDEISHGYNAYSILKTGSDEWGKVLPITNFRAYGDYPLPLNLYLTVPFISALGLNALSIRLPHVILGVLTVLSVYWLAIAIFKKKNYALLSAFLVSFTPWYLFTSRFVLQSNLAVFFLIAGFALFFNRLRNKWFLPLSIVFLGLTLFSYHSTRIFTPLIAIATIGIYRKELLSKLNVLLFLLFFLPLPFILLNPNARVRSTEVFLLNPNIIYQIEVSRNESKLPPIVNKIIYNRPVYLTTNFAKNYLEYFSPKYLFINGGTQYQFSVPNHGLLYLFELPFFYIGLLVLVKNVIVRRSREYVLLLSWLLLSPIPASITTEHFAVIRSTTMLPLPEILVTLGFFGALAYLQKRYKKIKKLFISAFVFLLLVSFSLYAYKYFTSYKEDYSWAWQYGYEDAVKYIEKYYTDYDKIIFTKKYGEPHEFVLFYSSWNPKEYKTDKNLVRFNQSNWWWVDNFDKFVFVNDWQIPKAGNVFVTESKQQISCEGIRCLLITSPQNTPNKWNKLDTINFLDGKVAFELYEN